LRSVPDLSRREKNKLVKTSTDHEQLQQQHQQKQQVLEPVRLMESAGEAGVGGTAVVEFSLPLSLLPLSPSSSGVPTPAVLTGPHPLVCFKHTNAYY